MAEGNPWPTNCKIVHTKDTSLFHLRVWLSSPEDTRPNGGVFRETKTVVAGYKCSAIFMCMFGNLDPQIILALKAEGAPKVSTHMVLLDKIGSPATSVGTPTGTETDHMEGLYGLIASWDDIKANCLVDNYFVVLCSVQIDWKPQASLVEEDLPELGHDLAMMFDKQEHTDVSFSVGRESFSAHRLVLAARSPVFKAELYGPMAESKMISIPVEDMEASTFKSMLHYMYHGSLSYVDVKDVGSTMAQYQHLLVAADRYGVEGLKKICENKLSGHGITIDSVLSMLELAEDHACPKLKARCFDFLADGDNFKMVAISDEYARLIQSSPNLFGSVWMYALRGLALHSLEYQYAGIFALASMPIFLFGCVDI